MSIAIIVQITQKSPSMHNCTGGIIMTHCGRGARHAFDTCPDIDADECLRHSHKVETSRPAVLALPLLLYSLQSSRSDGLSHTAE